MFVLEVREGPEGSLWARRPDYYVKDWAAVVAARLIVKKERRPARVVIYSPNTPEDGKVFGEFFYTPPEPVKIDAAALAKGIFG